MKAFNKKKKHKHRTKLMYKCNIKIGFLIGCNKFCKRTNNYKRYQADKVIFCN